MTDSVEQKALALAEQRIADMERAAFERGEAAATLKAKLGQMDREIARHTERLDIIGEAMIEAKKISDDLANVLQGLAAELKARDRVNEALIAAAETAAAKAEESSKAAGVRHLSTWQIRGVIAVTLIGLLGLVVPIITQALQAAH